MRCITHYIVCCVNQYYYEFTQKARSDIKYCTITLSISNISIKINNKG